MKEFKQKDIKEFALHLKTLGAYVQQPKPQVVGLSRTQVVGSQDAKSLYPTIMALLNIGYDTLRGRIYDWRIVGQVFLIMSNISKEKHTNKDAVKFGTENFRGAFNNIMKNYANRVKFKESKNKSIEFNTAYYTMMFNKIVSYHTFENILQPKTDEEYYLLKCNLYPLLEALTWVSVHNKGYNKTVIDYTFYNNTFESKYKNNQFLFIHDINGSKTALYVMDYTNFKDYILSNYVLNPYGTYFDTHDNNKSFEVDLILDGMSDRGFVKNQMLILNAITENWNKLNIVQQKAFILDNEHLDENIAKEVIALVGDSDEHIRSKQLKSLLSIKFETYVTEETIKKRLKLRSSQRDSKSNGIKVTLNSGYGIYGMVTWVYGNNLIANSITTGGKIYGIKLFQQLASNKLKYERSKIRESNG